MRRTRVLFLPLLLLPLLAGPAAAGGDGDEAILWGLWSGARGDVLLPEHPATMLCVWAEGDVHLGHPGDAHAEYAFRPGPEPHCRLVPGGSAYTVEEAPGAVRVLLKQGGLPRELTSPGVTPLGEAGSAVLVGALTPLGELAVTAGDADLVVIAASWPTLRPLELRQERGEWRVEAREGEGVVVLVLQGAERSAFLRWTDPGWHPPAPTIGEAFVPVALALLVSLFRGGAGGPFVRPGRKRPGDQAST